MIQPEDFEVFRKAFKKYDPIIDAFARRYEFDVRAAFENGVTSLGRWPRRYLKRQHNDVDVFIDLWMNPISMQVPFSFDPMHLYSMGGGVGSDRKNKRISKRLVLFEDVPFCALGDVLPPALEYTWHRIRLWDLAYLEATETWNKIG